MLNNVRKELTRYASKRQARLLQRFFKTGPGEYGEGDIFLGVKVPDTRKVAERFIGLGLQDTVRLLKSPIHEERLLALLLLVKKYEKADDAGKERIYKVYLRHTRHINNWDLVDLSSHHIVGPFLFVNG